MDNNQSKHEEILYSCPKCTAADMPRSELTGYDKTLCPYCGHEIIDLSLFLHTQKVQEVLREKKKLKRTPLKVAIIISSILLALFIIAAGIFAFNIDDKIVSGIASFSPNYYSHQMKNAYEDEDYDKLFDLLFYKTEKTINSSWYFAYRTAWYVHTYPSQFDEAISTGNLDRAAEIYHAIRADYLLRDDFFASWYDSIPEVEERLAEEYKREKAIMDALE